MQVLGYRSLNVQGTCTCVSYNGGPPLCAGVIIAYSCTVHSALADSVVCFCILISRNRAVENMRLLKSKLINTSQLIQLFNAQKFTLSKTQADLQMCQAELADVRRQLQEQQCRDEEVSRLKTTCQRLQEELHRATVQRESQRAQNQQLRAAAERWPAMEREMDALKRKVTELRKQLRSKSDEIAVLTGSKRGSAYRSASSSPSASPSPPHHAQQHDVSSFSFTTPAGSGGTGVNPLQHAVSGCANDQRTGSSPHSSMGRMAAVPASAPPAATSGDMDLDSVDWMSSSDAPAAARDARYVSTQPALIGLPAAVGGAAAGTGAGDAAATTEDTTGSGRPSRARTFKRSAAAVDQNTDSSGSSATGQTDDLRAPPAMATPPKRTRLSSRGVMASSVVVPAERGLSGPAVSSQSATQGEFRPAVQSSPVKRSARHAAGTPADLA